MFPRLDPNAVENKRVYNRIPQPLPKLQNK
jgi:hypothetical protein